MLIKNTSTIKSFADYLNESSREITICSAPNMTIAPTESHGRLFETAARVAGKQGVYRIYPVKPDTSLVESMGSDLPLDHSHCIKYARKMFPRHARSIILDESTQTIQQALSIAHTDGFTRANVVVPEDRKIDTEIMVDRNNGVSGRHGFYHFREGIKVISSGARTVGTDKLIEAASTNDYRSFIKNVPSEFSETKALFNDLRKGLGLTETHDFRTHIQLSPVSDTREEYVAGSLFHKGDDVIIKESDEVAKVVMLGSNYVLVETADGRKLRKWLDSVESIQESDLSILSPKLDRLLDRIAHGKKYRKGVKYYIQRHGRDGTRQDLVKTAKMTNLDFRNLEKVLHDLINKGALPKSLATRDDLVEENINNVDTSLAEEIDQLLIAEGENVDRVKQEKEEDLEALEREYEDKMERAERQDEIDAEQEKREDEEESEREQQDEDALPDVKGDQPKKYYKDVEKDDKEDRAKHFKRGKKLDDDDPDAYKPAPGDKEADTKPSKYTKKYQQKYEEGSMKSFAEFVTEDVDKALKNKADESGAPKSVLKDVYDRGVAAWKTGHRPGTTPSQWGLARVNSFLTYGKTAKTADKDLFEKLPDSVQDKIKD